MNLSVSIVIPMYNAENFIGKVLESIVRQEYDAPVELIVVNDGSTDGSLEIVRGFAGRCDLRVIDQPNQGAVAATNNGILASRYPVVCSVDSDVLLDQGWIASIVREFEDPQVGAVQGYIRTPPSSPFLVRMAGYDLEYRYDRLTSKHVTQVSTANTAYRRAALDKVGLFEPGFTYGYDNDMSYRLQAGGYRLVMCQAASCEHY